MSYEPHLLNHASDHHRHPSVDNGMTLLEELDKIAPIKAFDAFPKVQSTYTSKSRRGGVLTAIVGTIIFLLVLNDLGEYLYGAPDYKFQVDHDVARDLQLNVDLTIAMPCEFLTIDLRDAVGDRLHLSEEFAKEGTNFQIGKLTSSKYHTATSASEMIAQARRRVPSQRRSFSGISRLLFSAPGKKDPHAKTRRKNQTAYRPTIPKLENGPACRIYGSVQVKKVTANFHVTTLGHGYMSYEHTDHTLMNLTHIIHEFSFGPYFPAISQPLDMTYLVTDHPFTIYQYFLRVVPTTYIDAARRLLSTSQYAVTDYSRTFEHGKGVPGVFFKFDLEGMSLTIKERTTSLYQFLIRLVGVIGGVWTTAAFGLRVFNRAQKEILKVPEKPLLPDNSPMGREMSNGYFGDSASGGGGSERHGRTYSSGVGVGMGNGGSLRGVNQGQQGNGEVLFDYKAR